MFSSNISCVSTKIIFMMVLILVTACGKNDKSKTSSQVAAQVDGTEISMLQINEVLKNSGNITPENASKIKGQILDKLIDQQVIVKKAMNDNLDRSPEVMVAIESAKKDILSKAYLQQMVSSAVRISNQEVKDYYAEHEGLFTNRRTYTIQDVSTLKSEHALATVTEALAKQKNIQEITDALNAQNIKFSKDSYTRVAEQIPLDVLAKIQNLREGQIIALEVADTLHVLLIVKAEETPVTLSEATPVIKNYLFNVQGKKFVEDKMKQLRAQSNIVLMGEFTKAPNAEIAGKYETSMINNNGDKSTEKNQPIKDQSSIDKGVTGM